MKIKSILIILLFVSILGGCSKPETEEATGSGEKVTVQLDWVPEPEHGGLYQALAKGYFADEGLDVTLLPGGANIAVIESVATGQADVGQSASTQVITAASRGLPLKNIVGVFQQIPTALMLHETNPIDSFTELDGKSIMARPEALYIPFIKEKYGIDFDVIPQNFGLGMLINDPEFIQEGFYIAEPFFVEKEGVKLKYLRLSEAGYEVYATLFANDEFLESRPKVARAFVKAYVKGWTDYLEGDPTPAHEAIKAARNGEVDDAFLNFSRDMIISEKLGSGDPEKGETYGSIDEDRLANEIKMLETLGAIEPNSVTVEAILYR